MKAPKIRISIPHVSWRDGEPRFNPGPKLRKLGFRGQDLRHGAAGAWYSAEEALAWVSAKVKEIAERRAARAAGKRLKPIGGRGLYTVEDLFRDVFATPRMKGEEVIEGKRRQKAASPKTVKDYAQKRDVLAAHDGELFVSPVEALTRPILFGLYEDLWRDRGLSTARGVIAVLSAAISWGLRRGKVRLQGNPCANLGMSMPEPRVRALSIEEVSHLVAAADATGRPEIGDCILLAVWTGQRQGDRLNFVDVGLIDGRRVFRQAKTRAIVEVPEAPQLAGRLAAAKARRAKWEVQPLAVVVDEVTRRPFAADWYRKKFSEVRAAALAGIEGKLPAMPGLADAETGLPRDQDLRDTAVTWLARAGCTIPQIAAITGHSESSATSILKHYLAAHRDLADQAIAKAVAWYEGQGAGA